MAEQSAEGAPTTPASRPASWESYLTSVRGADHVRAGRPNEDSVAADRFELRDGGSIQVLAVADGHGHVRHFRSDRGSALAVAAAMSGVRAWAAASRGGDRLTSASVGRLVAEIVGIWRQSVADDLESDPITGDLLATMPRDDPPEIPYGATLLLAVLTAEVAVLAQIGDGEMLLVLPDGRHLEPVPGDSRLDGTRTTSLCQPDAVGAFRVGLVNLAKTPAYAVFAATDGYGNAQADVNWQRVFAADLVRLGVEHGSAWIGGQLAGWAAACASSEGSGDDTTAAIAINPGATLTAPRRPQEPAERSGEKTTQRRTMPFRPVSDAEKTLIWPDQPPPESVTATAPVQVIRPTVIPALAAARPEPEIPLPTSSLAAISRFWPVGVAIAIIVIAAVLFLTRGSSAPGQPTLHPSPGSPRASHTTGASTGGQPKPKPTPTKSSNLGGGASDIVRSAGPGRSSG